MGSVANGIYTLSHAPEQNLTLMFGSDRPGTQVNVMPPSGAPGDQDWEVRRTEDGAYTLRNVKSGTYAGFDGHPEADDPIRGFPEPRTWHLLPAEEPGTFFLTVPGPTGDLALDVSPLLIYPPLAVLRPLDKGDTSQSWHLTRLDA
ncbi:RICIN domain-containing protein [Streptomyces palmae]|uniref:Ricin B lectin domain-containing protein n=1 Tax=Streptomyces palmae TaxID=1701085 RepID=A0A4Z0FSI6_9ACTN|nr:RICIN domain-containing protein [Streptomyces palmae]TGA86107.1 hypothetical protein E4099_30575 [Streptomyces palmae]